jgi:hypothetical protein
VTFAGIARRPAEVGGTEIDRKEKTYARDTTYEMEAIYRKSSRN